METYYERIREMN